MQFAPIYTNNQNNGYPVIDPLPLSNVPGPIDKLNSDALSVILANTNDHSLSAAKLISKGWNKIIVDNPYHPDLLIKLKSKVAFGPEDWAKHMGICISDEDIRDAYVRLPDNIEQILNSPCPVSLPEEGKFVKDTHLLVYIPPFVSGKDINEREITQEITLSSLGKLIDEQLSEARNPRQMPGYSFIWDGALKQLDKSVEEGYWVLMTKDVLGGTDIGVNGSRNKSYEDQQAMVNKLTEDCGVDYVVPKTLEAVAVIIAQFLRGKARLFGDNPWTYIRCKEKLGNNQMVVGGFAPVGLCVSFSFSSHFVHDYIGVAGLRKFSRP